jgi:hypothetical protein
MKAIRPTKARAPTAKASHRIGVVEFLPLEGLNFAPSCWYRTLLGNSDDCWGVR